MGWTDWSMLAVGVGIGTFGNWWISRKLPQPDLQTDLPQTDLPQPDFQPAQLDAKNSSELQQLQTQLLQTRLIYEKAKEAEQFKAGFLARTAHELRSPLNRVMSLQQLIMADLCEDPAEEREFITQAYTAAQEMLAVLDKLIGVSKASYGTERLQIQPVCLEDVFMEVESLTLLQARNRNQQLKIEYPDSDVWVMADPRWLRQVLVSLVDTPMSLMQEGTIRVTPQTVPETQVVQVQIEDERPAGFWNEPLDLLQALYHRGRLNVAEIDKTTIPELEQLPSPGLSLFVNQTVLELMGGHLDVLSTPSETDPVTRIQCAIPLATEEL